MQDITRLQTFLYLLMRDELPTGAVARLVAESETPTSSFTATGIADYARELEL